MGERMSLFGLIRDAVTGITAGVNSSNQLLVEIPPLISTNNSTETPLVGDDTFVGSTDEINGYGIIYINVYADVASATDGLQIFQSPDGTNWNHCDEFTIPAATGKNFSINPYAKYMRVEYKNGVDPQSEFQLQVIYKANGKSSSHRIQDSISSDDDAELVKAVISGEDEDSVFQNLRVTSQGVLFASDFLLEVAKGTIPGHRIINKFGYNPEVDTGTDPEDVFAGGGIYNFFPTVAQSVEVDSTDAADVGSLVSSGTATGGSATTLIDTGATFQSDGVAVGDVVINDTNGEYGIVTAVDSETQLTHQAMTNASQIDPMSNPNELGDTYRVATNAGAGAGVVHVLGLKDVSGFWSIQSETVIMNGATDVALQHDYIRLHRALVVISADLDIANVGNIQVVDDDDATAIGAFILANEGQTEQTVVTVPSGKTGYFLKGYVGMDSGATVSNRFARFTWRTRTPGGPFRVGGRITNQTNGSSWWQYEYKGAPSVPEQSDIKIRCEEVSDNDTAVVAGIDLLLIDNDI
jgi:hypothetical protein